MKFEPKNMKRMTLRELLTHAEKCTRELIENLQADLIPKTSEFRDLNRPVRKRSHFPTLMAVQNAMQKLEASGTEMCTFCGHLLEQFKIIEQSARREATMRL
jgi:hypothetical protein